MTSTLGLLRDAKAVLAAGAFLVLTAASAFALNDPMLVHRVETALAADASDARFLPLEDAIRAAATPAEEKLDLLTELARLRTAYGYHAEAAEALDFQGDLMARLRGANAPELAQVHAATAEAYLAAGDPGEALEAARAALRIDAAYLACESAALARSYERMERIYRRLERWEEARRADRRSNDPSERCLDVPRITERTVTREFVSPTDESFTRVKVFYATDRARTGDPHPNDFYGGDRGVVEYGTLEVTVPRNHKPGEVEAPSLIKLEWTENPERHFVITGIEPLGKEAMFADIRTTLAGRGSEEAFVFVHGYNVTFSKAAKRTAQIAYDLNFDGAPILYSWPSRGSLFAYVRDETVVRLSGRHLLRFLDDVVAKSGARRINLIAHSMGNRAMIDALELMAVRRDALGQDDPLFQQAIFAAPDEDAALFALMLQEIRPLVQRMTLYGSEKDLALAASQQLHGDRARAGQGGDAILITDGVDSIDMTDVGSDMLGHSYFAGSASALTDMGWLFWRDAPPDRRCGMEGRERRGGLFWLFDPVRCDGPVLLSAMTILKTEGAAALSRLDEILSGLTVGGDRDIEAEEWAAIRRVAEEALAD